MLGKMKKINGLSCRLAVITAAYLSVLWQAHPVQSCVGGYGRYGRYENWPSNSDWDELLMLITGKYGKNGWGWHQQNSYAYSSLGDYPSGALKYSSNPYDTSGSGLPSIGSSNSVSSGYSGSQYNSGGGGGSGGAGSISKLNTDKIKEALNNFFKTKPKKASNPKKPSGWSSGGGGGGGSSVGGGGGFVGESFIDSPGPGPSYSSHDDTPIGPGPPYQDNINIGPGPPYESSSWSDGGSGPGPSSSPFSGGPPSGVNDQPSWPGQQESRPPQDYPSSSRPAQNSNYNGHGSNQLYNNEQKGNNNGGGGGSQFQSDYETFVGAGSQGDYRKKRRRQGKKHPFSNSSEQSPPKQRKTHYRRVPPKAGLPTRGLPVLQGVESNGRRPYKFPPYPGPPPGSSGGEGRGGGARRGISRRNRRMGSPMSLRRRMFNTKFGGYKVDYSRLRFG